jgi:hypothetical protein
MTTNEKAPRLRLWVKIDEQGDYAAQERTVEPSDYACCWCRERPSDMLIGEQTVMPLCRRCAVSVCGKINRWLDSEGSAR